MALLKFPTHRESTRTQEERRESLEFGKIFMQMIRHHLPFSVVPSAAMGSGMSSSVE